MQTRTIKAISGSRLLIAGEWKSGFLLFENGYVQGLSKSAPACSKSEIYDAGDLIVMAGLVDTHVHINEPGRTDWEGFASATRACAAGGITSVTDMPLNCLPVTTSKKNLEEKLKHVAGKLWVDTFFWGGAIGQSARELEELLQSGVYGVKSFMIDSGICEFPPVTAKDFDTIMPLLAKYRLPYLLHAELDLGAPSDGDSRDYGDFLASRPASWEVQAIELAIAAAKKHRCHIHIVHLSAMEALPIIARARKDGVMITVETCPHYLMLQSEQVDEGNTLFKCCPPIRTKKNKQALWQAVVKGEIDMIVSDHSPCTANLKKLQQGNFKEAWGGISSLQLTLPLIWSGLKEQGEDPSRLWQLMSFKTACLLQMAHLKGDLTPGMHADVVIWDELASFKVDVQKLEVKNKIGPYQGMTLHGKVHATILGGKMIFDGRELSTEAQGRAILKGK